jgi:hypothetical protein
VDALVCRFSYDTFFPQKSLMTRTGSGRKVHHINHCTVMFDTTSLYFQRNTSKITNGRCRFGCCNTSSTTMFCSVSSPTWTLIICSWTHLRTSVTVPLSPSHLHADRCHHPRIGAVRTRRCSCDWAPCQATWISYPE